MAGVDRFLTGAALIRSLTVAVRGGGDRRTWTGGHPHGAAIQEMAGMAYKANPMLENIGAAAIYDCREDGRVIAFNASDAANKQVTINVDCAYASGGCAER